MRFGKNLVAGDTWSWTEDAGDFDVATYQLKAFFRGARKLDLTADASTGAFVFTATVDQTKDMIAGIYAWQIVAIAGTNRTEVARGTVEVLSNVELIQEGVDLRSHNKRMLDAIVAVLEGRATRIESSYQINGRQLALLSPKELRAEKDEYARRYRLEQIEQGLIPASSNTIRARFV